MSDVQVITACPLCGSDRAPTKRVAVDLTRNEIAARPPSKTVGGATKGRGTPNYF